MFVWSNLCRNASELLHKANCLACVYLCELMPSLLFINRSYHQWWTAFAGTVKRTRLVWCDWLWNLWDDGPIELLLHTPCSPSSLYLTLWHFLKIERTQWFNCFHLPSLPASSHFARTSHLCCRTYEPLSVCECFLTSVPPRRDQPLHSVIGPTWIKYTLCAQTPKTPC